MPAISLVKNGMKRRGAEDTKKNLLKNFYVFYASAFFTLFGVLCINSYRRERRITGMTHGIDEYFLGPPTARL